MHSRFLTFVSHFINVKYKIVEESKETAEGKSALIVFSFTFPVVVFIWSTISCWKPFVSIFLTFENLVLCFGHYIFSRIRRCKGYVIFCFYQKMIFLFQWHRVLVCQIFFICHEFYFLGTIHRKFSAKLDVNIDLFFLIFDVAVQNVLGYKKLSAYMVA